MFIVFFRKIHSTHSPVAERFLIISKSVNSAFHRCHSHIISTYYIMSFCINFSFYVGHIRQNPLKFTYIQTVYGNRYILHYCRIRSRIYIQSGSVVVIQAHICINSSFFVQVDIIVLVYVKVSVNQDRIIGYDMYTYTFFLKNGTKSDKSTGLFLFVGIFSHNLSVTLIDFTIESNIKSFLIFGLVGFHLTSKYYLGCILHRLERY